MLTPSSSPPTLRIAIYRTSSLGDVVLATACLDLLDRLPAPAEVTWIGRGPALAMVTSSWPNIRGIELGRGDSMVELQRTVELLSTNHLLIDLQCNLRSKWLTRNLKTLHGVPFFEVDKAQITRSRLLVEARMRGRRKPLPERVRSADRLQYVMMCEALLRALRHHLPIEMRDGLEQAVVRPRLPIPDAFDPPWRKELRFGAWLGVAPGAAHPTKQAPLEQLKDILEKVQLGLLALPQGPGDQARAPQPLGLVFFGDDNDRQCARHLLDNLHWQGPTLNLAGRLSLWESAVALRETSCLLSNDSSLGHIAEAVDTPTAILFGPTVEAFGFAPRMRQSRAFSGLIGCRPCSKHGKVACRYDDKLCFTAINLDDVANHLVSLLVAPDSRHARRAGAAGRWEPQGTVGGATAAT
jgi:ADP-heptose:LPS heptosyltransferase